MAPVRNCERRERYPNIEMVLDGIRMGQVTYESTTPGFLLSLGGIHHWIIPRGTEEFAPALEAMRSLVRFAQFSRLGWVPGVVPTG